MTYPTTTAVAPRFGTGEFETGEYGTGKFETGATADPRAFPGTAVPSYLVPAPEFAVAGTIALDRGPIAASTLTVSGEELLLTHYGSDTVSVVDLRTGAVTPIPAAEPFALAATDNGVYVTTVATAYDTISLVGPDVGAIVATYPVAGVVRDLTASPDGKHVYVSRIGVDGADVAVIDAAGDFVAAIAVASGPGATAGSLRVNPDARRLYVAAADASGNYLHVVDTDEHRIAARLDFGGPIRDVALSTDGETAYVASLHPRLGGLITVMDTLSHQIISTAAVDGSPTQMTISGDGQRAYVAVEHGVQVLCLATGRVMAALGVDRRPSSVTESPDGLRLYVTDCTGKITVVSVATRWR